MLYILHHPDDRETVENDIFPLLENTEKQTIDYPETEFEAGNDDIIVTYLSDEFLREFLPKAAKKNQKVGILPHPENTYTTKGLGIANDPKEVIEEILENEEAHTLDMLYCNDIPIFQSVNIGNVFIFTEDHQNNNFVREVYTFFKNIRHLSSLSHNSYVISSEDEKIIHTSALGIIVVEHALSSVVARRLVSESSLNDGMFTVLIISPTNLLQLIWFLLRSLLPGGKQLDKTPSFIGRLKIANLHIKNSSEIEFTIDGEKEQAKEISLRVEPESLCLAQASKYCTEKDEANLKKSNKTDTLPTGEKREELTKRTLPIFPRATTEEFQELFKVLRENSKTTSIYVVMMILSTLIATFGLFADSSPVIIGAMILAPIISPIVSFAMGMVRYDTNMLKRGIITILIGTGVSLLFSSGVTLIIPIKLITSEIDARLSPTLLDMGIAVASGVAAAYAHAKEGIAKSLAGVAIAVALVPPLAVAGIGIGWWDWQVFSGAFLLYLTNLAGIIMFAGITFLVLGFAPFKRAKLGLVYTLILIGMVMVPLSLSFNRIKKEASITRELEGSTVNELVIRDVKVRFGDPLRVSLTLVGPENLSSDEIREIKKKLEDDIGEPINLEVISARGF
ncbi:TIGR00341 family protein [Salegentibacter salegens]|uniref:TIGR00341 family protein n=1 Tax=Salegentibacter salegens TaxID=143223 RepID=A0A1M7JZM5_9FLAO|nr:TIGR00341 family protein [Salegentibacter salegens]PRX43002.1 putative hydrophobic protein (TIGR00341 family) [Salegentibacter salegens]SHM58173.1 TIGR00341 family protein [Salegentibacter salegens]